MAAVTIIGGHGKIALRLARLLSDNGHVVTSWVRDPEQGPDIEDVGAHPAVLDVEYLSVDEMADALSGADVVVWSAGAGGGNPERTIAVDRDAAIRSMEACLAAGVPRYVMVSYFGAGPDHGVPEDNSFFTYAQAKSDADAHLRETDLVWTILAPSTLTDDAGTGHLEVGEGVTSWRVSRDDVASVAAYVIEHRGFARRTIAFNNGTTPIADALRPT
ncbi:NAD(P)-binding oxidoreductase [Knoellia subterranea]|uniref:NAD-dependent dehydratase n=1 Tax=Knoellia subterranea KCTC 19937 TaxID=1385521 RepID=A0A0A0JQN2_9MICO|nr:NAD(P)-binding oxidoreductase [Knoellia subterranea]KGN39478.1 NAD-dependent dehydratase [Knoellia subterranea KCTC 19937]